jgi:hypothetical protein
MLVTVLNSHIGIRADTDACHETNYYCSLAGGSALMAPEIARFINPSIKLVTDSKPIKSQIKFSAYRILYFGIINSPNAETKHQTVII